MEENQVRQEYDEDTSMEHIIEEKKPNYSINLKQIKQIQRCVRRYISLKSINKMFQNAQQLRNQKDQQIKETVCEKVFEEKSQNLSHILKQFPYELWLNIFMFIPSLNQIMNTSKVCKLFQEICQTNLVWKYVLQGTFPKIYKQKQTEDIPASKTNWLGLVKENQILLNAFKEILQNMYIQKESGNLFFKKKNYDKAREMYQRALDLIQGEKYQIKNYEDVVDIWVRIDHYKLIIILLSNQALMNLNLESYFRARVNAKAALKKLMEIKLILKKEEEQQETMEEEYKQRSSADNINTLDPQFSFKNVYEETFSKLEEKVKYRLGQIEDDMPFPHAFYHHTSTPVNELRVGTLLTHNNGTFGGGGIFGDSKVLMVNFNRETSDFIGIIINKNLETQNRTVRIGGPCEQTKKTTLHNIPNIENATRVVDGIYQGGDIEQYRNDSQYKIKDYYGYASWFSGQLDGEIRNGNGWQVSNAVTQDEIFNPQQDIQMTPYDFF